MVDQTVAGLIPCQTKDNVLAEYALSGIDKPIGVSSYELTRALARDLQSALPTVEEIEAELAVGESAKKVGKKKTIRGGINNYSFFKRRDIEYILDQILRLVKNVRKVNLLRTNT